MMTENIGNLIVEDLRHIRGRTDQIAEDMTDIKHRPRFEPLAS